MSEPTRRDFQAAKIRLDSSAPACRECGAKIEWVSNDFGFGIEARGVQVLSWSPNKDSGGSYWLCPNHMGALCDD